MPSDSSDEVKLLTKGDNNSVDDRGLYSPGQLWVQRDEVVGRARGYVGVGSYVVVTEMWCHGEIAGTY